MSASEKPTNLVDVIEHSYAHGGNVSCSLCGKVIATKGECLIHFSCGLPRISHDVCWVQELRLAGAVAFAGERIAP